MLDRHDLIHRYQKGEWRAKIFQDIVLNEIVCRTSPPVVLDIGCGSGFDGCDTIQSQLAAESGRYIGIEPDDDIVPASYFDFCHTCLFENADIEAQSIDIAFCVMVLEHLTDVKQFWDKLAYVLKPGGVFWGFTMDRRHFFCHVSNLFERLKIKNLFLNRIHGKRGVDRYENYPAIYNANSPRQITSHIESSFSFQFINFSKVGQLDYYVPGLLKPVFRGIDRLQMLSHLPGSILAVRLERNSSS